MGRNEPEAVFYIYSAMIFHLFIISSAVQIYEFSYIHYHPLNLLNR